MLRTPKPILMCAMFVLSQCATARPRTPPRIAPPPLPLLEDRLGIAGAPTDLLEFEFEPESTGDEPPRLELDGVPELNPETIARLQPYLESRRTYLQSAALDGSSYMVITRLDSVAQAYEVRAPSPDLWPITEAAGPIVQIARAPGTKDAWIYRSDVHGTEDYQLSLLRPDGVSLITDGVSRHGPFAGSKQGVVAFAGNGRNGRDMDIYLYAPPVGGAPELALRREGSWSVSGWSPDGKQLLLREYVDFNESSFWLLAPPSDRATRVDDTVGASSVRGRFSGTGTIHITTDRGGEFLHLYEVGLPKRDFVNLTPDAAWNVDEIASHDGGRVLVYSINEGGISRLWVRAAGSPPRRLDIGENAIVSDLRLTMDGTVVSFTLDRATDTGDVWTLDLVTEAMTRVTNSHSPELDYSKFADPALVAIDSFDDLSIPAWVYRPRNLSGPSPVLLWIHGGPEAQHQPTFHPLIQFLVTELGVAVVAPNIRGSSGYGRSYVALDDGLAREDAIRDVGAVLDWVQTQPVMDASRVAIFGGSYGGFVVLASLARYGARLAAGIDQVGVSNFVTFLENTSDYRVDQRRAEYGDERDPEMRQFLTDVSPTTNAHLIRSPLFVAHGANDPRVPVAEARQIVAAVREAGSEAQLMVALDEGHGFRQRANRDYFYGALVEFLERELIAHPPANAEEDPLAAPQGTIDDIEAQK